MAWLPEGQQVRGPERPALRDIEPLNRVFADAFTDRYRRDGMSGVRVPHLNPAIWRYAFGDAGEGAMIWRDADGALCAFNMVHLSGREGWMGPLAVRPDRQGSGLGKMILQSGIAWLKARRARTIGLETMPRTVENIGFYSQLGFLPGHLTVTLTHDIVHRSGAAPQLLSSAGHERATLLERSVALTDTLAPGTDFTRELQATADLRIGDTLLERDAEGTLAGFALFHTAPLAAGRPQEELRILKLVARDLESFERLLGQAEAAAISADIRRVSVRCQTAGSAAYQHLVRRGFRTHWTDLRMALASHPEPVVPPGAVVWSNWEI